MRPNVRWTTNVLALAVAAVMTVAAMADLQSYAPAVVSVTTASTTLLSADNKLKIVSLTNTGSYDAWVCLSDQTPVVGSGFYLPVGATLTFSGDHVPQQGLKAIANGGTTTVAVGRG